MSGLIFEHEIHASTLAEMISNEWDYVTITEFIIQLAATVDDIRLDGNIAEFFTNRMNERRR